MQNRRQLKESVQIMIDVYHDKDLGIFFDRIPDTHCRGTILSFIEDKKLKKEIVSKPLINKAELKVTLLDFKKDKRYSFVIPAGYTWDGASIPRFAWCTVGTPTDAKFLNASLIHDVLCENHHYVDNDRYFADKVFERLLYVAGVCAFNRWRMFHSVDNYQKFCGWGR